MNNRNMFPPPPPSTSSSSSQGGGGGGLMRYGSAPSSVISTAVESVRNHRQFSSSAGFAPETCAIANLQSSDDHEGGLNITTSSSSLVRHSSMPAGFLNHLPPAADTDAGFCMTRGMNIGSRYDSNSESSVSRLNSQLSFTRPKEVLSWISEENDHTYNADKTSSHPNATASFTMESQFQFGMAQTALELTTMDNLLNIPHDSVPCKIRAKRGFATHPRSIAERERRTRISGKLKKLQDLVPNMDKQTSYADMLDLAVQHIKCLQNEVHKLNNELDSCTCGCKKTIAS